MSECAGWPCCATFKYTLHAKGGVPANITEPKETMATTWLKIHVWVRQISHNALVLLNDGWGSRSVHFVFWRLEFVDGVSHLVPWLYCVHVVSKYQILKYWRHISHLKDYCPHRRLSLSPTCHWWWSVSWSLPDSTIFQSKRSVQVQITEATCAYCASNP